MTEKIVAGVDCSETSENALRWGVNEARLHGARLVAVHAWDVPVAPGDVAPSQGPELLALISDVRAAAEELVEEAVRRVTAGSEATVSVDAIATQGAPASVLIDFASDADLLVVGSRGLGGFARLLLGSVSQQCLQHAPCPVLVHRTRQRS